MLKTALSIIKNLLPDTDIREFQFIDTSSKAYFMIALYGKTYYEKYFHALIENDAIRAQYYSDLKKLQLIPRENMPFAAFKLLFDLRSEQAEYVQPLYETAHSFAALFQEIRKKYASTICHVMQDWIDNFIVNWVFGGKDHIIHTWKIQADRVQDIEVENWTKVDGSVNDLFGIEAVDIGVVNHAQRFDGGGVHDFGPDPVF